MKKSSNNSKKFIGIIAVIIGIIVILIASTLIPKAMQKKERMDYTEYLDHLKAGDVNVVLYRSNDEYMTVILFTDETKKLTEKEREEHKYKRSEQYEVMFPDNVDFKKELLEYGVIVKNNDSDIVAFVDNWLTLIIYLALVILMLVVMGKNNPLKSGGFVQKVACEDIDVSFDDVIGHDEIKEDLRLLVKQLSNGAKAKDLSHGILFEGSAGTGKTMLAKAVAHEAGVNFLSVNSSNLIEMYVGLGAKRVRDAFKQAKAASPCILFFDEIDAVGTKRGLQGGHRENDQTINALLSELDGFTDKGDIIVIAATNRADTLDDALKRSGRFDRLIKVEAPTKWETRQKLFEHYLKEYNAEGIDTETLAKQTVGFSGADIAALCREANMIAYREDCNCLKYEFIEEAIDKMVFKGNRSNEEQHKEDIKYVAYHEAGHAVMSLLLNMPISRISIMGMTSGIGGAVFQSDNDKVFKTRREYEKQVLVAYAGRASEQLKFGEKNVTQGASNDISKATNLLLEYATKLGFDENMGLLDYDVLSNTSIIQNDNIAKEMSRLSKHFYDEAIETLNVHYDMVSKLAERLMEVKTLSGDEVSLLLKNELQSVNDKNEVKELMCV